ncbi:MAG TPA: YaiO family outer membrane beta-barrel protein [Puia sp.]|nr:YaiO family outer membrane beta-barrel protein [Puia sp.]
MSTHLKKLSLPAILLALFCISFVTVSAQDTTTADGLFLSARKAAFDQKDYPRAKAYLYKGLSISPDYADLRIFLGRIYTWTHHYDSAKACFLYVWKRDPRNEDAALAYTDLEYWNDHYEEALTICTTGLQAHPASEELLLRKAKILNAMKRFAAADSVLRQLLHINKDNTAARALDNRLKELSWKNKINSSYDFVYFDKQFKDPWHLVSLDYGRSTKFGTITGRINYANRFRENGVQYELEAYPHISPTFYSYAEVAYSNNDGVFPQWRGGFSLYANLPSSFEGELGVRYLQFSGSPTWIYTAYLGKYYKSWLWGGRIYLTPATYTPAVSVSYSLSARYYYGGADDLVGVSAGYGISPDDRYNILQLEGRTKLTSYNVGVFFKKKLLRRNVLSISANWLNQEYLPHTIGNQYQTGIAWQYRF